MPLKFERQEGGPMGALPEEFRPQERRAEVASVIDITDMITGLEASRRAGGR